jgi:hypothetical protein
MKAFLISTTDEPGVAGRLLEATAARGVNVTQAYGLADGRNALMVLGSDDESGLEAAIADAGKTATPIEMFVTELENKPGSGAALFRKLADAGVNLRVAVPIGMTGDRTQIALGAEDPEQLRRALAAE